MLELVAIEADGVELIDLGTDEVAFLEWIEEQNEEAVEAGYDATDYRIVEADTRNCPAGKHSSSHHATKCLAQGWKWENLGQ